SELLALLESGRATRPALSVKGTVYLAETSFDLKEKRDALKRELVERGYAVLPDRPLPLYGPDCTALVREQLARCRMSVHLVGRSYGVVPEGSTASLIELQHELAVERCTGEGFSRLVWLPSGVGHLASGEAEDERQQRFIAHLQTDARLAEGADLLEST